MDVKHTSWPDKYRPDDLEGMALAPDLRERFERSLSGDTLPRHLILYGPPGFGKTTIAMIIADTLYSGDGWPRVMRVKSGETGNVDYIRTTVIGGFMRATGTKLLIFEEASGLSPESQEALRVPLEDWADLCRVIFITNDLDKLADQAVRDRCEIIEIGRPPLDECARVLGRVLEAEGITIEPATVLGFTRAYFAGASDDEHRALRSLLRAAQDHVETTGTLPVPPEAERSSAALVAWEGGAHAESTTDGAKLLDDIAAEFNKYLALPKGGVEALTLWTIFAWAHEAFSISPILTLASPTKGAGKTTAFEMMEQLLVPEGRTRHKSNITPAALYRGKGRFSPDQAYPSPTPKPPDLCLLLDEADSWLNLDREMKGIINSGWKRSGASVSRADGEFSTWFPKALALIDQPSTPLPGTLRDRSIVVPMQKKSKGEQVEEFPSHRPLPELRALCEAVAFWVRDHFATLRELGGGEMLAAPELKNRGKPNWHQLMAIARVAGGGWEKRARWASLALAESTQAEELLVDLLRDIKSAFDAEGTGAIRSVTLVEKLVTLEGSQWKDKRFNPTKLADMLRPLGIRKRQLGTYTQGRKQNANGYRLEQFEDAWSRYL